MGQNYIGLYPDAHGNNRMSFTIVVGTRPEIIKMAPIIRELKKQSIPFNFIYTGQHYDYNMSLQFIKELNLPKPEHCFKLKNKKPAKQIGEMMTKLDDALRNMKINLLLIQGDTNTMLAAALTGIKLGLKIGHVEAGIRSYDWRMPEEHNRRMIDHISDILFAPTKRAERNLMEECIHGKVHVTGNTIIDSVNQNMPIAEKYSKIMQSIIFKEFSLVTVHRAENVDDPETLKGFVAVLIDSPIPTVFPVHPRTLKRLKQQQLLEKLENAANVQLLSPLGYFDFLVLMKNCEIILTDSGGLQEEATAPCIRKPVLVIRLSTERPESVEAGFAKVVGVDKNNILKALNDSLDKAPYLPLTSPFGNGRASKKIVKIIKSIQ